MGAALLAVDHREDIGNRNPHGAPLRAVMAAGAGDRLILIQRRLGLPDDPLLRLRQGLELLHEAQVVLHLGQAAHAAEHRQDVVQAGAEADGPGRVAQAAARGIQDLFDLRNRIRQDAALDRLHDGDGLAVGLADLPAPAGGHARIFPVGVIQLQLDEIHLRMLVQQLLQQHRVRVEGEAVIFHQALPLLLGHEVPDMILVILLHVVPLQRVQQIVVEIAGSGPLQAGPELLLRAFLVMALHGGVQLGAEGIGFPGIPVRHRLPEGRFAFAVVIHVGCVEVGASRLDKTVRHLADLGNINLPVRGLGQPHQPKAQPERVFTQQIVHGFSSLSLTVLVSPCFRPSTVFRFLRCQAFRVSISFRISRRTSATLMPFSRAIRARSSYSSLAFFTPMPSACFIRTVPREVSFSTICRDST